MDKNFGYGWIGTFVLALFLLQGSVVALEINMVSLHQNATISDSVALRIADAAVVQGPDAAAIGSMAITPASNRITQAQLLEVLTDAGYHRGNLVVKGHLNCEVVRINHTADARQPQADSALASIPIEIQASAVEGARLRDRVVEFIARLAQATAGELRIEFSPVDEKYLDQELGDARLEIEPGGTGGTGRVPLIVRRYRGDELVDTRRIAMVVTRRFEAVVLTRTMSKGELIGPGDVKLSQVHLTGQAQPVTDPAQAVGKMLRGLQREGSVLMADQLEQARLVKRGQLITVRSLAGLVSVTITGRALDDGCAGELIQVRNEKSRQTFTARVTADGQALMVSDGVPTDEAMEVIS